LDALSLEVALHCWRLLSGLGCSPVEFGCVQLEVLTTSVILGELPLAHWRQSSVLQRSGLARARLISWHAVGFSRSDPGTVGLTPL